MKKNKKAIILIYAIILVTIGLSLAIILLNDNKILELNKKNFVINKQLLANLTSKANQIIKYEQKVNSDGSGFTDIKEGSGANIFCRLQASGEYLLEGDSGSIDGNDLIDDNCNDDNYLASNSGTQDYPNGFEDNDEDARININYIIPPLVNFNIFFNNKKTEEIIDNNTNNTASGVKLSQVESGSLYLNMNTGALLNIFEFDKNLYNSFEEIKINNYYSGAVTNSGYITISGKNISLDTNINNSYKFDFKNKGFFFMLKNIKNDYMLHFNLNGKQNGKKIYLVPINDSNTNFIEILSYDIIEQDGDFISKLLKFEYKK